jgi:integrase/recombinase XerD
VAAATKASREVRTYCGTLHATGCRISEALALTAQQIDLSGRVVVFESLKKRRRGQPVNNVAEADFFVG